MPDPNKLVLVRTLKERVRLAFFCLGIAAFMGFMLRGMIQEWKPVGIGEHIIHAVGLEIFLTFEMFSIFGVIWGLFAPSWLERLLQWGFQKVVTIICVTGVVSIISVTIYLLTR